MIAPRNAVLLVLALAASLALLTAGFVTHAPNRLVSGAPILLWHAASAPRAGAIAALCAALVAAAFLPPARHHAAAIAAAAALLLLLLIDTAGSAARDFAAHAPPAARASLGATFWIAGLCAALAIVDGLQRLGASPALRLGVAVAMTAAILALAASGRLDALSLAREYAVRRDAFAAEFWRHCALVAGAVAPALVIGVPLGILAARRPRARGTLFGTLNIIETVPSVALFGLLIAPLAALGLSGVGPAPALIALILYALLPVARNTEAGILGTDPAAVEAATGMGMTPRQIFWRVELPLGLPVFVAGLRIVVVQTIGLAAVAALIGAGGLGTFIFQGIGQYAIDLVLLGALPTIGLALAADFALAMMIPRSGRRA
jgi:osmoprotectant transport system permease protein